MTVKELMSQVDPNRVNDAMMLMDYIFSPNNYDESFMEKFNGVPKHREIVEENIRAFAECSPSDDVEMHTIFIFYTKAYEDLEKEDEMIFTSFATNDNEVWPILDKEFHMFCKPDELTVHNYGYDDSSLEELACYKVADQAVEQFGLEVCAAYILKEIFWWGATPEYRAKRVEETYTELRKRIEDEEKELIPAEKVHAEWREELLAEMTGDEKEYFLLKEKFEKEISEIERRYWAKGKAEYYACCIKAVRIEYEARREKRGI